MDQISTYEPVLVGDPEVIKSSLKLRFGSLSRLVPSLKHNFLLQREVINTELFPNCVYIVGITTEHKFPLLTS